MSAFHLFLRCTCTDKLKNETCFFSITAEIFHTKAMYYTNGKPMTKNYGISILFNISSK